MQAEIAQLDVFHSATRRIPQLEGHRATAEGIENKALQTPARTITNGQALATSHSKLKVLRMPIQQNDQTIFGAIARRVQLIEGGKQAKI